MKSVVLFFCDNKSDGSLDSERFGFLVSPDVPFLFVPLLQIQKMSGFILPLPDSRLLGRIFQKAQNFDKTPRNHVAEMALESL